MRSRLLAMLAALALAVTAGFVVGCGDDDDDGGDGGGGGGGEDLGLIQEGQLLVGTDTPYAPFEIGQPPNISGFDIDVVNDVGERLDLTVEYQDTSFDTSRRDLAQGKFDMVVAATTISDKRETVVDFSDPYYEAQQALIVPEGSDIATTADLEGKTVGAQDGTTGEDFANDETGASDVRGYPEGPDAINAVKAGQVDAVIIDEPVAQEALSKAGAGFELAETITTEELYGLVLQEEDDALREQVNEALAEMKEDGTLGELYEKYFPGTEPPPSVVDGTHEPS